VIPKLLPRLHTNTLRKRRLRCWMIRIGSAVSHNNYKVSCFLESVNLVGSKGFEPFNKRLRIVPLTTLR
jgi:hypothetical protein